METIASLAANGQNHGSPFSAPVIVIGVVLMVASLFNDNLASGTRRVSFIIGFLTMWGGFYLLKA